MTKEGMSSDDPIALMQEAQLGGGTENGAEDSEAGLSLETPEQEPARLSGMAEQISAERKYQAKEEAAAAVSKQEEIERQIAELNRHPVLVIVITILAIFLTVSSLLLSFAASCGTLHLCEGESLILLPLLPFAYPSIPFVWIIENSSLFFPHAGVSDILESPSPLKLLLVAGLLGYNFLLLWIISVGTLFFRKNFDLISEWRSIGKKLVAWYVCALILVLLGVLNSFPLLSLSTKQNILYHYCETKNDCVNNYISHYVPNCKGRTALFTYPFKSNLPEVDKCSVASVIKDNPFRVLDLSGEESVTMQYFPDEPKDSVNLAVLVPAYPDSPWGKRDLVGGQFGLVMHDFGQVVLALPIATQEEFCKSFGDQHLLVTHYQTPSWSGRTDDLPREEKCRKYIFASDQKSTAPAAQAPDVPSSVLIMKELTPENKSGQPDGLFAKYLDAAKKDLIDQLTKKGAKVNGEAKIYRLELFAEKTDNYPLFPEFTELAPTGFSNVVDSQKASIKNKVLTLHVAASGDAEAFLLQGIDLSKTTGIVFDYKFTEGEGGSLTVSHDTRTIIEVGQDFQNIIAANYTTKRVIFTPPKMVSASWKLNFHLLGGKGHSSTVEISNIGYCQRVTPCVMGGARLVSYIADISVNDGFVYSYEINKNGFKFLGSAAPQYLYQ